jgi:hypothetical protein
MTKLAATPKLPKQSRREERLDPGLGALIDDLAELAADLYVSGTQRCEAVKRAPSVVVETKPCGSKRTAGRNSRRRA